MKYASRITARFVASGHLSSQRSTENDHASHGSRFAGQVSGFHSSRILTGVFQFPHRLLRRRLQAVMSRSAAGANHSSEPPVTTRYSVQKDACVLLSTICKKRLVISFANIFRLTRPVFFWRSAAGVARRVCRPGLSEPSPDAADSAADVSPVRRSVADALTVTAIQSVRSAGLQNA